MAEEGSRPEFAARGGWSAIRVFDLVIWESVLVTTMKERRRRRIQRAQTTAQNPSRYRCVPLLGVPFNPASRSAPTPKFTHPLTPETTQSSSRPDERVTSEAMSHPTFESVSHSYSLHESTSHLIVDVLFSRQRVAMFKKPRSPKDTPNTAPRLLVQGTCYGSLDRPVARATAWMQHHTEVAHHLIQQNVREEGGRGVLTSDILAVRARFNLTANFVVSEVVLAHLTQWMALVNKLILIAWACPAFGSSSHETALAWGGNVENAYVQGSTWFRPSTDNFQLVCDQTISLTHDCRVDAPPERGSEQLVGCVPFLDIYVL
ncbi:unnamed protein product [Rhizoctonia solani]|uniref:Uncharacterized protein n=1 Tax=Rhizoctonia solani TaxID=456999 RepID=A0A8H3E3V7_9AGAM|nr:unnamed protein product [Rhizoctonia solani]